ncbi:hypothetical protein V6N11_051216 [Hibiscus sabdariffa]|uniref:Uncharacterized protein n=1 Tax=Hibiscus sabdariffa TaxID=183260 RepID=A0ABR2N8Q8_9ROSI
MQECVNNEVVKGKNIQLTSTVRLKKSGLIRHTNSSLSCPPLVDVSNESRKDDVVGVQEGSHRGISIIEGKHGR